jgi:UDP-N-acetylmuramoyl-L-alanyl-D-glutamate--2,6-diaminopimelate ligase
MLLFDLLKAFDPKLSRAGLPNAPITGVQEDSRKIQSGHLFIARPGTQTDGSRFAADAKNRGAVAMVVEQRLAEAPLPQIVVKDAGAANAILAHLFHGNPTDQVKLLAVTGTNGKTTSTYISRHLLSHLGRRCGLIGTVQLDDGRSTTEASLTTPSASDIAQLLAKMRDNGCWTCALEASSHALDQRRLAGATIAGAAFTNLSGDHLDYHKTMEQYAAAKARLFEALDEQAVAVINAEDAYSARMIQDCPGRIIRFGFTKQADYYARDIASTAQGTQFTLITPDGEANVRMGLIGRHNIENALTAAALVGETFGLSVHQLAAGLGSAQGAPGRLQAVRAGQPFAVLVDYAHTDDALENVLSALRPLVGKGGQGGKLRVLFGCGGDRDRTKRPRMARIAHKLADALYITSDNPRTEQPQAIVDEIRAGLPARASKEVFVEIDRRRAIEKILADARAGDIVLLAGKGHENYQILGTEKHHFDDVEEAERCLQRRAAVA